MNTSLKQCELYKCEITQQCNFQLIQIPITLHHTNSVRAIYKKIYIWNVEIKMCHHGILIEFKAMNLINALLMGKMIKMNQWIRLSH